jgi:2-amino-4-hydroxy-6-hydroxymethyldihydropteridine diphosphokinase
VAASRRPDECCPPGPVRAFVSVGSNIEPAKHLRLALDELGRRFGPLQLSSVYRNRAEGFEGEDFLNMVVGFDTTAGAAAVIAELEQIHHLAGRVRGPQAFASRTLDLDLILYGDRIDPRLRLPRPDVTRYGFVLGPLAEIAPQLRHPATGETIGDLWDRFDQASHPLQRLPVSVV